MYNALLVLSVDGQWGLWTETLVCPANCEFGTLNSTEERYCDAPSPQYGGLNCPGVTSTRSNFQTNADCGLAGWFHTFLKKRNKFQMVYIP